MRRSAFIVIGLAAATGAVILPPRAVETDAREITLAVWGMPFEDRLFRDIYARGFEELHPGWSVNYVRHVDLVEKYKAWHVLEHGADVMRMRITDLPTLVAIGAVEPLDDFIADPGRGLSADEIADFLPFIWEELEMDGRKWAIPSDNAQYGVYYNRSIFDAYNAAHTDAPLAYPTAEWTWDDLKRAADALTARNASGDIIQFGIAFDLWSWPFMAFLKQAGGELWDESQLTTRIDSAEGVEALQFMIDVLPPGAPVRSPELAEPPIGPAQLFALGKVAILLDGSWRVPGFEKDNPDLDFAVAPMPHHRNRAAVSGSVVWGISAHSEHKEKAWELIKWMTSREGSLAYWRSLRVAPPAQMSVVESEAFRTSPGLFDEAGRVWVPAMNEGQFTDRAAWLSYAFTPDSTTGEIPGFVPVAPYQADLEDRIALALVRAYHGDMTAAGALREARRETHAIIDRDRRARGLPAVQR
jgi:multiple sugar transport system substrate-binding protein